MLSVGLLFSFIVTSLEFYFKAKRRRLLDGVRIFILARCLYIRNVFGILEVNDD